MKTSSSPSALLRPSRVLSKLRAGGSATCLKLNLADPRVAEIAAIAQVDALWLCNEHVLNHWINLENQIRAAKVYGVDTIVRVEKGSYSDYLRPFEADATGILVPHVSSASEARQIVEWTRYHPLGRRAIDGGNADTKFCAIGLSDYIRHAQQEQFVILQIESPEALENVDEIAAVPGYDMLCFGPGDFSHLLGVPGQLNHPAVVAARRRVAAAARAQGKFAMAAYLSAPRAELEGEGHTVFNLGADVVGLTHYARSCVESFSHNSPVR